MSSEQSESRAGQTDRPVYEQFRHTVSKDDAKPLAGWAEHLDVGDTIQWTTGRVEGVQESKIVGFSSRDALARPVIEPPTDVYDVPDGLETFVVDKRSWVPKDSRSVAEIELEYTQTMTVKIPVDDFPAGPESAFNLVKDTDPEFVADVLPNTWDDAVSSGDLSVVGLDEEVIGDAE